MATPLHFKDRCYFSARQFLKGKRAFKGKMRVRGVICPKWHFKEWVGTIMQSWKCSAPLYPPCRGTLWRRASLTSQQEASSSTSYANKPSSVGFWASKKLGFKTNTQCCLHVSAAGLFWISYWNMFTETSCVGLWIYFCNEQILGVSRVSVLIQCSTVKAQCKICEAVKFKGYKG